MSNNIIEKLARNHPEDSVSDVLCMIFNEDKSLAKKFLQDRHKIKGFEILSVIRNYSLQTGKKPDITFIVRKKRGKSINFFHVETKITATENRRGKYQQYKHYTNHMNKHNSHGWKGKKCILLCPSYECGHDEEYADRYNFSALIKFIDGCNTHISKMLIHYIENNIEYSENKIIKFAKDKLKPEEWEIYANLISKIREIMVDIRENRNPRVKITTGGLWKKASSCFTWSVGFRRKGGKKNNNGFLSYDFYTEEECKSPLRIYYKQDILKNYTVNCPHYNVEKEYYSNVFDDPNSLRILNAYSLGTDNPNIGKRLLGFVNKASRKKTLDIVYKGNVYFRSIIMYIDLIDDKLDSKKWKTTFSNECSQRDIIYRLQIEKRKCGKHLSIVFEPTNLNQEYVLRWESDFKINNTYMEDKKSGRFIKPIGREWSNPTEATTYIKKHWTESFD